MNCNFSKVKGEEVSKLINSMTAKSSPLDILPTKLLKSCSAVFSHMIARLANLSFEEWLFPTSFKTAQVLPLLKKPGLDITEPSNYRPISNSNTVSKILEWLCSARVKSHLLSSANFCPLQSAYRVGHSTETALLHLLDDVYQNIDNKLPSVIVGLDISAAFDMVNHETLLDGLRNDFGIDGKVLAWLKSYLSSRRQFVKIGQHTSNTTTCQCGVLQGSVLGPLLGSISTAMSALSASHVNTTHGCFGLFVISFLKRVHRH